MSVPDVATTAQIMDRYQVSLSTAKRIRREALELSQDLDQCRSALEPAGRLTR
jgi:hypothetical protein